MKPELGIKRISPNCGTRYYDFRKDPPTCPACATVYDPEALLKSRRARPGMVEELRKTVVKPAPPGDFEDIVPVDTEDADLAVEAGDDVGDALIEDAAELGEDEIEPVEVDSDDEE